MKHWRGIITLLAFVAMSLGARAKTVALFYDGSYVETNANFGAEAYNMKTVLESQGFTVNTFSGITSNDFATALAGMDTLIVPELELGNLGSALSPEAVGVIAGFVADGNTLIHNAQHSPGATNDENFINTVFGYSITADYNNAYTIPPTITMSVVGTVFDGGPSVITANDGDVPWLTASLPAGTLSAYEVVNGSNTYSSVAQIPQGSGQVVLLSWDWYGAAPNGTQDGGWNEILWRAIATTGLGGDFYVDITSTNAVFPYDSWTNAATNIQHAVSIAGDGSTVHVNDGTYMLSTEILVSSDILIQSENGPGVTFVNGGGVVRGFNLGNSACIISGFTITNGYAAGNGGGVACSSVTPIVTNCVIRGNTAASNGGGMTYGTANNCIIRDNHSQTHAGASFYMNANNCLIVGNTAVADIGGVEYGTHTGCTIVSNTANRVGGAAYGTYNNCIVRYNTSVNTSYTDDIYSATVNSSCASDIPHGVNGNITNAPAFVDLAGGDYRLAVGSPCVDSGNNSYVAVGADLDGRPRIMNAVVDMGAYEFLPRDHYVSHSGSHEYPFETWERAATNIQAAVDAAPDSHTVHVTNGTYLLVSEIDVNSDILIQSVNGPYATVVDGGGTVRGFNLDGYNCILNGFTVANGYASDYGGGIRCSTTNPVVTNCVVSGNIAAAGGGITYGTVYNSVIRGNMASLSGGTAGGMLWSVANNCIISSNTAYYQAGGTYETVANNCLIEGNQAYSDVGGTFYGTYKNCTIVGNTASNLVGGVAYGEYDNCIIWYNTASSFNDIYSDGMILNSVCSPDVIHGVNNNTTNAPSFMDLAGGDYRLKYGSPCINTGDNGYAAGSFDLDGAARIIDIIVDIGAYEYDIAVTDSDGDGLLDGDELNMYCSSPLLTNTDGDAYDDAYEVANGFAPGIYTDLPGYLDAHADSYGYYTESEVLNLGVGDIGGMITTNGTVDLWVQLWQSDDLITWTNAGPPVFWSEPMDSAIKLYRVSVEN